MTRLSLAFGLTLVVVGIGIAIWDSFGIRDYLVALSAQRSKEFRSVTGTMWLGHLVFVLGGFFAGVGVSRQFASKNTERQ